MAADIRRELLCWLVLLDVFYLSSATFIHYPRGYEYIYHTNSSVELKDVQKFFNEGEVGFVNIAENDSYQELLMIVHKTRFSPSDRPDINGQIHDLSKWFSFEMSGRGEIGHVIYPSDEKEDVINLKKGYAGMLSAKLHHRDDEVIKMKSPGEWEYETSEIGKEGFHNATYSAKEIPTGYEFRKRRTSPLTQVVNGNGMSEKTLQIHSEFKTIDKVTVKEKFKMDFSKKPGFDPFYATRRVHPVTDFIEMDIPAIEATAHDELHFLKKRFYQVHLKRPLNVKSSSIHHIAMLAESKLEREEDIRKAISFINGNMTCIRRQPAEGSPELIACFQNLIKTLEELPDKMLENVTDMYLGRQRGQMRTADRLYFIDAIGALHSHFAQSLLDKKILSNPSASDGLHQRALLAVTAQDIEPSSNMLQTLRDLCLNEAYGARMHVSEETKHRACLTFGSAIGRLRRHGREEEAIQLIDVLHFKLGLHDPWLYRQKRAMMTEYEAMEYDLKKVVLLDSIGNARVDSSFEYIVSHINSSNSQWIKRTGVHALRGFHDVNTLLELKKALYDEDETVRYEAKLQYQAHPLAELDRQERDIHPDKAGISKRSILEKSFKIKLEAPGVDWQKRVGSSQIGGAFGVIMENLLDIELSLLKGKVEIRVHDEAYSRVHFGYVGISLDFYSARVCFKGSTHYGVNIIQEADMELFVKLIKNYKNTVNNIVKAVRDGVDAFKSILNGDFSLKDVVDEFIASLEEIPTKVLGLGSQVRQTIENLYSFKLEHLPPFVQPVKKFVEAVTQLYDRVREDVMTFYNSIVEAVKIIIPQAAEQIFESVQGIIRGFMKIFKDPKTALFDIGKGVIVIYANIKQVNKTKNDILEHTFVKDGVRPYWSDLNEDTSEITELYDQALHSLQTEGKEWVSQLEEGDLIAKITHGKLSLAIIKETIVSQLESDVEELMGPLLLLENLGGKYLLTFFNMFDVFEDIKDAYTVLKNGYKTAKSVVSSIFGNKFDKDFPRTRRVSGGGCTGNGFYPSRLDGGYTEYRYKGIDVLASQGQDLVAPVSGTVQLSDISNEIIIKDSDDFPEGSEVIITNVEPAYHIVIDSLTQVSGGEVIGKVTNSPCVGNNHVHISVKRDGGFVDPSDYLADRVIESPTWEQICDDYKLVYRFETVDTGFLVGLPGRKEEDTTEEIPEDKSLETSEMEESNRPAEDIQELKSNEEGMYTKIPDIEREKTSVSVPTLSHAIDILVYNIKQFLEQFSLRRIKLGAIIQFLEELGLEESKEKMAQLIKDIMDSINNKQCRSPYYMTEQELDIELLNRGKQPEGNKEQMIKQLTTSDISCPFISLSLPDSDVIFCTLDEKCVGIECCITIELFDLLQKSVTAYVRLDGDPLTLTFGLNTWKHSVNSTMLVGEEEDTKDTKIAFDFLDDQHLVVKYKLTGTETEVKLSFGVGVCDPDNTDDCFVYIPLLKNAIFPLPSIDENGNLQVQPIKVQDYLDEIKENVDEAPTVVAAAIVNSAIDDFLEHLGIDKSLLLNEPACPRPQNFEEDVLRSRMQEKGLSTTGSREDLEERYRQNDLTFDKRTAWSLMRLRGCAGSSGYMLVANAESTFSRGAAHFISSSAVYLFDFLTACTVNGETLTLPTHTSDLLYYFISEDCMKIQACLDIAIPGLELSRSFNAYLELDPCNFILNAAFEKKAKPIFVYEYEWGKNEIIKLADTILIILSVDKNDEKQVFQIDFDIQWDAYSEPVLNEFEIPIPVCNNNFTLQGSLEDLADALGGQLNEAVFNLLLKQLKIYDIIYHGECTLPPAPVGCPESLNLLEMIPEDMKDIMTCVLADNCFGIYCCAKFQVNIPLSSEQIDVAFPVWFRLEPCAFTIHYGIAGRTTDEPLLQYEWGKEQIVPLGSDGVPSKLTYTIGKMENGFVVDMAVDICFAVDDEKLCIPRDGIKLLVQQELPLCDARAWVEFENFSYEEWITSKGEDINEQLSGAGREALVDYLGIKGLILKNPCDRERSPYIPSLSGWNNKCPLSFVSLPELPESISCSVPDYCTGIDCCFDIEKIGLSIHAYIDINLCTYVASGGIETETFSFSLLKYEWGKTETVTIKNFLRLKYSIKNPDEKIFIVNLKVAACFESDGPCMFEKKVLDNTEVPQIGCDMSIDYSDFSISTWLQNNGLTSISPSDTKWEEVVGFVFELVGVKSYLLDEPCTVEDTVYANAVDGWHNECVYITLDLPALPSLSACHIASSCTAVECCINADYIKRTIHASLNIDFCDFVITGNLEKLSFERSLIDYNWGKEVTETILDFIQIRYTVDKTEKHFVVDLTMSVCMDSNTACQFNHDFYKNTLIPIPICNLDMDFSLQDFSLTNWLNDVGQSLEETLPDYIIQTFLSQLGLSKFQQTSPCQLNDALYLDGTNGWNSECSSAISLPTLPENIVCYIPDYCTGIDCCIYIDFLRTTLHIRFLLDTCSYKLIIGIERLEREITLLDYTWGQINHVYLNGAVRINYKIDNIQSQMMFIVNAQLGICFEKSDCLFEVDILKDAYLPKPFCSLNAGLLLEGYNLTTWMESYAFAFDGDVLKDFMVEILFRELGIAPYLLDEQCDRTAIPFADSTGGFSSDCPHQLETGNVPDTMTCFIHESCSALDCCIDVNAVKRSFSLYINIDPCSFLFTIGIEKYKVTVSLLDYVWGTVEEYSLFGALRVSGSIVNLETEKQFIVSLWIEKCLESEACEEQINLLENARLPKTECENHALKDFNFDQYVESSGQSFQDPDVQLTKTSSDKLLDDLGVLSVFDTTECSQSGNSLSECEKYDFTTEIPDGMTCTVPDYCTAIECCVFIPLIDRSLRVNVDLNACEYMLTVSIGRFSSKTSLLTYNWGEWNTLSVMDVFIVEYNIEDLKFNKEFVVSVNMSACFDTSVCVLEEIILSEAVLPHSECVFDEIPEFSLSDWIEENTEDGMHNTTDNLMSKLYEDTRVAPYLILEQCEEANTGWTSECPISPELLDLPAGISCHQDQQCTGFECCLSVPELNRAFRFHIKIDMCNNILSTGIENLEYNQPLIVYKFGTMKQIHINGILRLRYNIDDISEEAAYKVTSEISLCLESSQTCDQIIPILDEAVVGKPICDWDMDFQTPGFMLDEWFQGEGIAQGNAIDGAALARLNDALGFAQYLLEDECSHFEAPFTGGESGWSKACPLEIQVSELPEELRCFIPSYCTGVDCCVSVDALSRNFRTSLFLDSCENRLVLSIESLKVNISLHDYEWGSSQAVALLGVVRIRYAIHNYEETRQYGIDVNISVCLSSDHCELELRLLENVNFTKQLCSWDSGYLISNFSLETWLQSQDVDDLTDIPQEVLDELLRETGLVDFLKADTCNRSLAPYIPSTNGWRSDCERNVETQTLPSPISCVILEVCSGFQCCVDVDILNIAFEVKVQLDVCKNQLAIELENRRISVSLNGYEYGKEEHVYLLGVLRVRFTVYEPDDSEVQITASVDVCLEHAQACMFSANVFQNTFLPVSFCDHGTGFQIPDFSFDQWRIDNGVDDTTPLTDTNLDLLMSTYGLHEFLLTPQCSRDDDFYIPTADGIKLNGCADMLSSVSSSVSQFANCAMLDTCLGMQCCVEAPTLLRNFEFYLNIDICRYIIEFKIENFTSSFLISTYELETWRTVELQGVLKIQYRIFDIVGKNAIVLDLLIKVCLSDLDNCIEEFPVLEKQKIPRPQCEEELDYTISSFSFTSWLEENGIETAVTSLSDTMSAKLLNDLDLTKYIFEDQCIVESTFVINECTSEVLENIVPEGASCQLDKDCMSLVCCVESIPIGRNISLGFEFDPCDMILTVRIEQLTRKYPLSSFSFGQEHLLDLFGLVNISYTLKELSDSGRYALSLDYSFCLDETTCLPDNQLLDSYLFPKPNCQQQTEGFDLQKFEEAMGIDISDTLDPSLIEIYLHQSGLGIFLSDDEIQCDRTQEPFEDQQWTSECLLIDPTSQLPDSLSCYIGSDCSELLCCMDTNFIQRSISWRLKIDTCLVLIEISIERFNSSIELTKESLGVQHTVTVAGVINIKLKVEHITRQNVYVLDLSLSVCFDRSSCVMETVLLEDTEFKAAACDFNKELLRPEFSLLEWKAENNIQSFVDLSNIASAELFEYIGFGRYLSNECNIDQLSTDSYSEECLISPPLWFSQGEPLFCIFKETCSNIQCCLESTDLGRSFSIDIDLRPNDFEITVAIERFKWKNSLVDYEWGEKKIISLYGLITLEFTIYDVDSEGVFIVDLRLRLCTEHSEPCSFDEHILANQRLTKTPSIWMSEAQELEFSLDAWLDTKGLKLHSFTNHETEILLETLGVGKFLLDEQFHIADVNDDTSDDSSCFDVENALNSLSSNIRCKMSSDCMVTECCIEVSEINRSFRLVIDFDPCNYKLSFEFELFQQTQTLFDFEYGTEFSLSLYGVINLRYSISDLPIENLYSIDVSMEMCFGNNACPVSSTLLNNAAVSKPLCSEKVRQDLAIKDFSFLSWMSDFNLNQSVSSLPPYVSSILLTDLDITTYLMAEICELGEQPFEQVGWNSESCLLSINLPDINSDISCSVSTTCTSISCCLPVPLISRNLNIITEVDPCELTMTLGIEKLQFTISLIDYNFGTEEQVWLGGIFRMAYTIYDVASYNQYLVSLSIEVYWDEHVDYQASYVVLENQPLPKIACSFTPDFIIPGFSLSTWLEDNGLSSGNIPDPAIRNVLLADLGLSYYIAATQCDYTNLVSLASDIGWINECSSAVRSLQDIDDNIVCSVMDECTRVDCCVNVAEIGYNLQIYLDIDHCQQVLTVRIERFERKIPLVDYEYDKYDDLWLFGLIRIRYKVVDLEAERKYLVDMNISVCLESDLPCAHEYMVFHETKLPKIACSWGPDADSGIDFSISDWMEQFEETLPDEVTSWPEYALKRLYTDMGVADFLTYTPCIYGQYPYDYINNTRNDCATYHEPFPLLDQVACRLDESCTSIDCCIDVQFLARSIHFSFNIHTCDMSLHIGIEKYTFILSLIDYDFGVEEHFWLRNIIRLSFQLFDLAEEDVFVVNLDASVCLETDEPCSMETTLLSKASLPKPSCSLSDGFKNTNFSIENWRITHGYAVGDDLTILDQSMLMNELGIQHFMSDQECSIEHLQAQNISSSSATCSLQEEMLTLTDEIACYVSSCTYFECCTHAQPLQRSFRTSLSIDACTYELVIRIENLIAEFSLLDFEWGTEQTVYLKGVTRIIFTLEKLDGENAFVLTLATKVCLEAQSVCFLEQMIFDRAKFPRNFCNYDVTDAFAIPEFSLLEWKQSHGLQPTSSLEEPYKNILFHDLGLLTYMLNARCKAEGINATTGWINECPDLSELETLPSTISCSFSESCSEVTCCLQETNTGRNISFGFEIDRCDYIIRSYVEDLKMEKSFYNFTWGINEFQNLFETEMASRHTLHPQEFAS